jgi:tripartite-type tricarboxylate transporter receptor subunit TctC
MVETTGIGGNRRRLVIAAALGTAAMPWRALAQGFSGSAVRLIVPQTPGTTPDLIARLLAPKLQARFDQPFVVENRPGASGAIGTEMVAKAAPDGRTLMVTVSTICIYPHFYPELKFDVFKSFQPIIHVASSSMALAVHKSVPVSNVQEFIAYVKARPGKLNYGSAGNGTHHHMCMELLKLQEGLDIVHVPYKGSAGANGDLIAGVIPAMFTPVQVALPMLKAGQIKILGQSLLDRHPLFPDIPSLSEQGVKDFNVDIWIGVWGPAGLPANVLARHNAEIRDIVMQADMKETFAKQGLIATIGTPEELAQRTRAEYDMWGRVVREAKIKFD